MILRWLLALLIAPLVGLAFIFGLITLVNLVSHETAEVLLFMFIFIAQLALPATWIGAYPAYWFLERKGQRSALAYGFTATLLAFVPSLVVPHAALLTVPLGAVTGLCIWCALWLGRPRRAGIYPKHRWSLRAKASRDK